jgi:EAL domain-containing protein (putative c-di-GMP-specific phosphodiesterase class I)
MEPPASVALLRKQQTGRLTRDRLVKDLEADKFVLHFQAIVAVAPSPKSPGYREILIRFIEEERNMQPPGMFLPLLEEQGLMPVLDRWVVGRTARWIGALEKSLGAGQAPCCSVNLSPDTILRDDKFGEHVLSRLLRSGASATSLSFEIPVADAVSPSLAQLMPPLRAAGCTFALSGFTGAEGEFELASAVGFEIVKIDGSMLSSPSGEAQARARLASIHSRCKELGMRTVCMQVEAPETLETLREIGIDYAQGFGIERPRALET